MKKWLMFAAAGMAMALFVAPALAKRIALDSNARRFNHAEHDKRVAAKGVARPKCAGACHKVDPEGNFLITGKREHARCFESCHSTTHKGFRHQYTVGRRELKGPKGQVCYACHGTLLKYRPSILVAVNQAQNVTFAATYSHKRHTAPGAGSGRQCEQCHGEFGTKLQTQGALAGGHRTCSGCHERGIEPLMNKCDGCHVDRNSARGKTAVMKPRQPNRYATTGAFSHERHARQDRVGTQGRECLTCHQNISKASDDATIPLPTMQGCYKQCHNGKNAFDATGAMCTRCHSGGRK